MKEHHLTEPLLPEKSPEHEIAITIHIGSSVKGGSNFLQATFNNVGVLVGLGMLSCPYSLQNGGWLGLILLLSCGFIFCYSAHLLGLCLSTKPNCSTYQQIAELAFGRKFRIFVTMFVYLELLGALVGFTLALSNNLVKIFPYASVDFSWLNVPAAQFLPIVAVILVLPIIWTRNLSWVSYVSLAGIVAYLLVAFALLWAGIVNRIGFDHRINVVNPVGLTKVTGLYLFCYSGHLVVPRICSSMKFPTQYTKVAILSFSIATVIYLVVGIAGATMFGEEVESQVTLNLPTALAVSKVALWVVILIPLTKYALNVNPIAVDLESFAHRPGQSSLVEKAISICIRTSIMAAVLAIAFSVPSFETTLALIGSTISTTNCVIFPCLFHMKIFRQSITKKQICLNSAIAVIGVALAVTGTIASVRKV